jgi:hypothetical protein
VEGMIAEEVPGELATLSEDGSIEWDISSDDQPTLFD